MNEQKQLNEMSELELKALAYDQLCVFEQVKTNLGLIKQEIDRRAKKDV